MSHFTIYVVTKTDSEDELEEKLQPYHEYECTGIVDQYVKHIDKTQDAIEDYKYAKVDCSSIYEFFKSWYGCILVYRESDPLTTPELITENYAIISDDESKILKYYDFTNPNSKWDYWRTYSGFDENESHEAKCVQKKNWDLKKWEDNIIKEATNEFNTFKPLVDPITFISWDDCLKKHNNNGDAAREEYHTQPTLKNYHEYIETHKNFDAIFDLFFDIDPLVTRDLQDYIEYKLNNNAPFWAIVDKDGNWIEHGHMGWWAITSNEDKNWGKTWRDIINNIPDNYYIWCVDCHI